MEDLGSKSTAEIVRDVADDLRLLVRKELELARRELVDAVGAKLKGAGLVAAAAIAALPGLLFLFVAAALWIPLSPAAGFAIVGGSFLLLGALAVWLGVRSFRKPSKPAGQAIESIKEDVRWARRRLTR